MTIKSLFTRPAALMGTGFLSALLCSQILLPASVLAVESSMEPGLAKAVASPLRSGKNVVRDRYRHPQATLAFFEVKPDSHVVEIWPGRGWYSEILAPYLADDGRFYAAHFPDNSDIGFFTRMRAEFAGQLKANTQLYGKAQLTQFYPPLKAEAGPAGAVDHVLTFRNVHNWMKAGYAAEAFAEFFTMLKPGGILGVVEHRAKPGTSEADMIKSGYVTEARVEELARAAGFELLDKSEINANELDSTHHPKGVWTLPPTLRLGDEDRSKYLRIGESDRMTLKFRKP